MPLIKPKDGENKKDFLERCMSNKTMNEDYPDNKQRYAVCNSQWERKSASSISDDSIEVRTFTAEIRADEGKDKKPMIVGTAAVFNELSLDLGGFKEIIHPESVGYIINTDDIFALKNHDVNLVLGRNKSGTLFLEESGDGLNFIIYPPDTSYANDLLVSMKRKDMDKCSFAFRVADEYWETIDGEDIRHITKFKELFDVSIVTYPAFPQTVAELFGKSIKTPEKVYAEYRSKINVEAQKLIESKGLAEKLIKEKEYRDRLLDLI